YLISGEFSDLTTTTKDQEFREKNKNNISFPKDNSSAIEAMVYYMYRYDYNSSGNKSSQVLPILFNVKVYYLIDKYNIPKLKKVHASGWDNFLVTIAETEVFEILLLLYCRSTLISYRKRIVFFVYLKAQLDLQPTLYLTQLKKNARIPKRRKQQNTVTLVAMSSGLQNVSVGNRNTIQTAVVTTNVKLPRYTSFATSCWA
ncbi:hypothetical protein DPV78_011590, partial [Talaromyces pinophilus]